MSINTEKMSRISEAAYLSADKANLYRTIIRILYNEKEMFNAQHSTDEIYEKITACKGFSDLSLDELKAALDQLTNWGNLVPMQDPKRAFSIEAFRNKQYRYSLTEYSIKIERMTIELENLFAEGKILSTYSLKNIELHLSRAEDMVKSNDMNEVNEWWKNLQEEFRRLNQNYSDYLHTFYSVNGEKLMQSLKFIAHKDKFVEYLRNFVMMLNKHSEKIRRMLSEINGDERELLTEKIIKSEEELPRTVTEKLDMINLSERIRGQWNSLYKWFVGDEKSQPVYRTAMDCTDEIIRRIVNNAFLLMRLESTGISRKNDYRQYMSMFAACRDIDEAHRLSAHVFGAMNTAHYKYCSDRETDSIFEEAYELKPQIFEIRPQTRSYKPRIRTSGFRSNELEKSARREAQLEKIRREQEMIESCIKDNRIDISELSGEKVPSALRTVLLKWIAAANQNKSRSGITDSGKKFHVRYTGTETVLHCDDGDLYMPGAVIEFEVNEDV